MRGGGEPSPERRQFESFVREQIAHFHDYETDELLSFFTPDDVDAVDAYQRSSIPQGLVDKPVPVEFSEKYPTSSQYLKFNTSLFDEPVEDRIANDEVMQRLFTLKRQDRTNINITAAMRARRSVLVMLWHLQNHS